MNPVKLFIALNGPWVIGPFNFSFKLNLQIYVSFSPSYCHHHYKLLVAFDFSHHGHALVTLYVQFLCSSKRTGPSCSKMGLDNPGFVRDLNSDLKA